MRRRVAFLATWSVLLAGLALGRPAGGAVLGHAQYVTSSPGAGTVVATAPTTIAITFSEPIQASYSTADVLDERGTALVERAGRPDPADPYTLLVPAPAMPSGTYTVRWRTVSAADGHAADGFFSFGVGNVAAPSGDGAGSASAHAGHGAAAILLEAESRALSYLGLMLALGFALAWWLVARATWIPRGTALALVASAIGSAGLAVVNGIASAVSPVQLLIDGRSGQLLLARLLVAAIGGTSVWLLTRRGRHRPAMAIGGGAALAGIALVANGGHAAAFASPVPVLAAFVHVAAAGAWIGGLLVVGWAAAIRESPWVPATVIPRFSAIALVSIALVGLSGAYADWLQTGDPLRFDTQYALILLVKLVLAGSALAVGAVNYLGGGRDRRRTGPLAGRIAVESALALAVVLATGFLTSGSPPADGAPIAIAPAFSSAAAADATLGLQPGRPGATRFAVTLPAEPGTPSAGVILVQTDRGAGESRLPLRPEPSADRGDRRAWVADGGLLPPDTAWEITVVASDAQGVETGRTRFVFTMGGEGVSSGLATPAVDPATVLGGLALLLGVTLLLIAAAGRLPRTDRAVSRRASSIGGVVSLALGLAILIGGLP